MPMSPPAASYNYETANRVVYAQPNGEALRLTLYLPRNTPDTRRPGLVMIHGGGWIGGTRYQMGWYGRHFAAKGYVTVSITYRKLPKHPFPACVHDAKAAVRWMRLNAEEYGIDPNRIAVMGQSAGGHLAAMVAATQDMQPLEGDQNPGVSSAVQAAICVYGALDLNVYGRQRRDIRGGPIGVHLVRRFVGGKSLDAYREASPVSYFSARTAPTLFIHGDRDRLVPVAVSQQAYTRLREAGVHARLLVLPGRGHSFDHLFPKARRAAFNEMLAFLEKQFAEVPAACAANQ